MGFACTSSTDVSSVIPFACSAELGPWVHVLPVVESSWVTPEAGRDPSHWHGPWAVGYRLMGDWRLEFMPRFVKALGHRHVLGAPRARWAGMRDAASGRQRLDRGMGTG